MYQCSRCELKTVTQPNMTGFVFWFGVVCSFVSFTKVSWFILNSSISRACCRLPYEHSIEVLELEAQRFFSVRDVREQLQTRSDYWDKPVSMHFQTSLCIKLVIYIHILDKTMWLYFQYPIKELKFRVKQWC